jgi:hypothetical protein
MLGFALSLLCLRLVSVVDHGDFLFVPFWLVSPFAFALGAATCPRAAATCSAGASW